MNLSIKDDCELCGGRKCTEEMIIVKTLLKKDVPMKITVCYECGSEYATLKQTSWNRQTYLEIINNHT